MTKKKITNEVSEEVFLADLEASLSDLLVEEENKRVEKSLYTIKPAPIYSAEDIQNIRKKYNYSQKTLASILNVSVRTVENWEISKSKPNKSVYRLLELLDKNNYINIIEDKKRLR